MKTIWKFPIECNSVRETQHRIVLMMPFGAEPLCVMRQGASGICIWAEVDTKQPLVPKLFLCIGTGHGEVPDRAKYLGSVLDDPYVWHIYVATEGGYLQ